MIYRYSYKNIHRYIHKIQVPIYPSKPIFPSLMAVDNWLCVSGARVSWKSKKHIDVRYQFVWEIISEGRVLFQKIEAVENLADLLTRVVTIIKFNHYLDLINITKV